MNNGKSWNWRIVEFNEKAREYHTQAYHSLDPYVRYAGHCRARGCSLPAEVYVVYNYVTGRQGRVSEARKVMCRRCAEAAVAKHAAPAKV